jgi:hypothetical protein
MDTHRRTAPVDCEQTNPEPGRDAVVGMPREPGVAAAVQVDDRPPGWVADVVDPQRETTSVARIPSAR